MDKLAINWQYLTQLDSISSLLLEYGPKYRLYVRQLVIY